MMIPLTLANHARLLLKNAPSAEKPKPSTKNVKLIPSTKNSVFTITRLRG